MFLCDLGRFEYLFYTRFSLLVVSVPWCTRRVQIDFADIRQLNSGRVTRKPVTIVYLNLKFACLRFAKVAFEKKNIYKRIFFL